MELLQLVRGCTFDDFLFMPQKGLLLSRDPNVVDLSTRFSEQHLHQAPPVSANMDTVTRSAMAVLLAEEGGIGVIDRGFRTGDIQPQVMEVEKVKRTQHGIITAPHTISGDQRGSARTVIQEMLKHLCSAISYGGAQSLRELRKEFWAKPASYAERSIEVGIISTLMPSEQVVSTTVLVSTLAPLYRGTSGTLK